MVSNQSVSMGFSLTGPHGTSTSVSAVGEDMVLGLSALGARGPVTGEVQTSGLSFNKVSWRKMKVQRLAKMSQRSLANHGQIKAFAFSHKYLGEIEAKDSEFRKKQWFLICWFI